MTTVYHKLCVYLFYTHFIKDIKTWFVKYAIHWPRGHMFSVTGPGGDWCQIATYVTNIIIFCSNYHEINFRHSLLSESWSAIHCNLYTQKKNTYKWVRHTALHITSNNRVNNGFLYFPKFFVELQNVISVLYIWKGRKMFFFLLPVKNASHSRSGYTVAYKIGHWQIKKIKNYRPTLG